MSRILPLLGNEGNRQLLGEWISRRTEHDIAPFDELNPFEPPFDLCIIDGPSLEDYSEQLREQKKEVKPEFLPVLLLVPRERSSHLNDDVWEFVDDIIWTSIGEGADSLDTFELSGRLHSLLRTRALSQTLFEDQQRLKVLHRVLRHNLRNSLNVIHGAAESIGASDDDKYVGLILNRTSRLLGHSDKAQEIEQILERNSPFKFDLGERMERLIHRFEEEHPSAQLTLEIRSSIEVSSIEGVSRAIEEAIQNAIIHSVGDSPKVDMIVDKTDQFGVLTIEDTGPLIPEQDRRVLRGDLEPTPLDHGTGVGLWLIVWTVRRSHGKIRYRVSDDGGNRLEIQLPSSSHSE